MLRKIINNKKLFAIFLLATNADEHVSIKINTFIIGKGGLGAAPPEAEELFKKIKQNGGFSLFFFFFFFCFLARLPISPEL